MNDTAALSGYSLIIHEATGRTDPAHLAEIEECMRHDIFHSTLDWQTRDQLHAAAREADQIMVALDVIPPQAAAQPSPPKTAPNIGGAWIFATHRALVERVMALTEAGHIDSYSIHAFEGGVVAGVRIGDAWLFLAD